MLDVMGNVERDRERVTEICLQLPEVTASSSTGQHTVYTVRNKKFAYYLVDHHGDGRVELECRVASGENGELVAAEPDRFFLPKYIAHHGWVGLYLDKGPIDWAEIEELITDAYLIVAPKRLAAQVTLRPS
jgi:hypothetical protein